jgi:hypothetical protein
MPQQKPSEKTCATKSLSYKVLRSANSPETLAIQRNPEGRMAKSSPSLNCGRVRGHRKVGFPDKCGEFVPER